MLVFITYFSSNPLKDFQIKKYPIALNDESRR